MRTRLVFAVALVAVACAAGSAGAASNCRPSGSHARASDGRARVYVLHHTVYGCDRTTGKTTVLGGAAISRPGKPQVDRVALAGNLVAYGSEVHGVDTGSASITVRRLSDGKRLGNFAAVTGPVGPESFASVKALVVNRTGGVGWIATSTSIIGRGSDTEVHGDGKLLDSGSGIVASSLRLRGTKLSWRHSGTTKSATLDAVRALSIQPRD